MPQESAIYVGTVTHKRLRPKRHQLRYRVFSFLLDLDEIDGLDRRHRLFSRNRFNLISFHDRDHGDRSGTSVRTQIEGLLATAGLGEASNRIMLLCYPRLLGFAFNPLSVYFCLDRNERLRAIVYEVSNTFGERHSYVIPAEACPDGTVHQETAKRLYVSPFNEVTGRYGFHVRVPGEEIAVGVLYRDAEGPLMKALFHGSRRPLGDGEMLRLALAQPFMTLKVIAGIHWEALRLWLKGLALTSRPPAARFSVTYRSGAPHD